MKRLIFQTLLGKQTTLQRKQAIDTIGNNWTSILFNEGLNTILAKKVTTKQLEQIPQQFTSNDWSHYLNLQNKFREQLADKINRLYQKNQNTIIFLSKKVYYNQLRISQSLRKKGWQTIALFFDDLTHGHQSDFFDLSIYSDLLSFLAVLSRAKGWILHTQGWLFRYYIPVLIDAFTPQTCRHLVEFMDIQSFFLPDDKLELITPYMKRAWGDNCIENHLLQLRCEKYIINNVDRVIFTGNKGHQQHLVTNIEEEKFLNFGNYPLPDFFARDHITTPNQGTWKLVFVGGIPPLTSRRPPQLFGDAQLLSTVRKLLRIKLKVDIYNNPLLGAEKDYKSLYADYISLQEQNKDFHFHRGVMPWKLADITASYDFGLMIYDFSGVMVGDKHFHHIVPSKLFAYLEAGLPVLVSSRLTAVCEIVNKYGIGLCITEGQEERLTDILHACDYRQIRKNVIEARQLLSMDKQIDRLCKMYQ